MVIHYGRSGDEAAALAEEVGAAGTVQGDLAAARRDGRPVRARGARWRAGRSTGWSTPRRCSSSTGPRRSTLALAARLYAVNCTAPVLLAQALAAQGAGGAVVNLLDQKVANPNPDFFSYTLSQGGAGGGDGDDGAGVRAARAGQRGGAGADAAERRPERGASSTAVARDEPAAAAGRGGSGGGRGGVSARGARASPGRRCSSIAGSGS